MVPPVPQHRTAAAVLIDPTTGALSARLAPMMEVGAWEADRTGAAWKRLAITLSVLAHAAGVSVVVLLKPTPLLLIDEVAMEVSIIVDDASSSGFGAVSAVPAVATPAASPNQTSAVVPVDPGGPAIVSSAKSRTNKPAEFDWGSTFDIGKIPPHFGLGAFDALQCPLGRLAERNPRSKRTTGCDPIPAQFPEGFSVRSRYSPPASSDPGSDGPGRGDGHAQLVWEMKRDPLPLPGSEYLPTERPPAMRSLRTWLGQLLH
ncbi:hypothetical protein RPC_2026 [Rhodopseudomonas palustris BisB18]|uniref:Uncharacterized protein n=1 Tax=Rhodopseudomonas palustris (strain BisB18) TaxID=316056 RepID=Q216V5_RHOPB